MRHGGKLPGKTHMLGQGRQGDNVKLRCREWWDVPPSVVAMLEG